jgi:hypothetical protein
MEESYWDKNRRFTIDSKDFYAQNDFSILTRKYPSTRIHWHFPNFHMEL